MSINKVLISGNLTRDAETRVTNSGTAVLSFTVAVNDRRRDQSGEWGDYVNFIPCTLFGNRANAIFHYMTKGTKVCISGKLHYSSYPTENGQRSKIEVIADEIELMSRQARQDEPEQPPVQMFNPDEIPF